MITYVVLATFTDQGVKNAKDSPGRCLQADGEDVWSDREEHILDARTVRHRDGRRGS